MCYLGIGERGKWWKKTCPYYSMYNWKMTFFPSLSPLSHQCRYLAVSYKRLWCLPVLAGTSDSKNPDPYYCTKVVIYQGANLRNVTFILAYCLSEATSFTVAQLPAGLSFLTFCQMLHWGRSAWRLGGPWMFQVKGCVNNEIAWWNIQAFIVGCRGVRQLGGSRTSCEAGGPARV